MQEDGLILQQSGRRDSFLEGRCGVILANFGGHLSGKEKWVDDGGG